MTSETWARHRDAIALVLAILGAAAGLVLLCSLWFGLAAASRIATLGGAAIGVAAMALTRQVPSPVRAAVAGVVAALGVEGLLALAAARVTTAHDAITTPAALTVAGALAVAATGLIAAATAAVVPRRLHGRSLVPAATLVIGATLVIIPLVGYAAFTVLAALHVAHTIPVMLLGLLGLLAMLAMLATPMVAGAAVVLLVPASTPSTVASAWLLIWVGLVATGIATTARSEARNDIPGMILGMMSVIAVVGGLSALGAFVMIRRRRRASPALPTAHVVS